VCGLAEAVFGPRPPVQRVLVSRGAGHGEAASSPVAALQLICLPDRLLAPPRKHRQPRHRQTETTTCLPHKANIDNSHLLTFTQSTCFQQTSSSFATLPRRFPINPIRFQTSRRFLPKFTSVMDGFYCYHGRRYIKGMSQLPDRETPRPVSRSSWERQNCS
jgi:hypothetical protein